MFLGLKGARQYIRLERPGFYLAVKPRQYYFSLYSTVAPPSWRPDAAAPSFWALPRPDDIGALGEPGAARSCRQPRATAWLGLAWLGLARLGSPGRAAPVQATVRTLHTRP